MRTTLIIVAYLYILALATVQRTLGLDFRKRDRILKQMQDIGRIFVISGIILIVVGVLLWLGKGFRLPGDIYIQRENFSFAFPIVTCIILSIIVTLLLNIFRR